jgi:hypothetical protein
LAGFFPLRSPNHKCFVFFGVFARQEACLCRLRDWATGVGWDCLVSIGSQPRNAVGASRNASCCGKLSHVSQTGCVHPTFRLPTSFLAELCMAVQRTSKAPRWRWVGMALCVPATLALLLDPPSRGPPSRGQATSKTPHGWAGSSRGTGLWKSPAPVPSAAALPARVRRQVRESCKKPLADARFGMKLPVAVRLGRLLGRF